MSSEATLNLALLLTTALVMCVAGVVVWLRVRVPGARVMALMLFALALNSGAYGLEFTTTALGSKIAWEKVLTVGSVTVPTLWLAFAILYTGRGRLLTGRVIALLCVVPAVSLALALTNGAHHLFWEGFSVPSDDAYLSLQPDFGPAFAVHAVYSYTLLAVGTVLLLGLFRRSWRLYRGQAIALLVAVLLPWATDVFDLIAPPVHPAVAFGSLGFCAGALLLAIGLTRLRVGDVLAVSRTTILDSLLDGVLVMDGGGRILYSNPSGTELLDRLSPAQDGREGLRTWPQDVQPLPEAMSAGSGQVAEQRLQSAETTFDLRLSPVRDSQGQAVAHVVVARDVSEQLRAQSELRESGERLGQALESTVHALSLAVESRDPYTMGHQQRVAALARAIAAEMGLEDDEIHGLYMAGEVHDIGKIKVPIEILSRPGVLTANEFALVRQHAEAGYEILKGIAFPWPVATIVRQHHEKLDGSGYPLGLRGDDILPAARILCVADVVEAMASDRPYRPSLGLDAALREIKDNRGTLFDPDAVDACERVLTRGDFELPQA